MVTYVIRIGEVLILSGLLATLVYVAMEDLSHYTIRNKVVAGLAVLFAVWCAIHADAWLFTTNALFAAAMFLVLVLLYTLRMMGGGDVKLLTVAFLWLGMTGAMTFAVALCVFSLAYGLAAKGKLVPSRFMNGRTRIPFGPSIAAAWIATLGLQLAASWPLSAAAH